MTTRKKQQTLAFIVDFDRTHKLAAALEPHRPRRCDPTPEIQGTPLSSSERAWSGIHPAIWEHDHG